MEFSNMSPRRPYILRAFYDWLQDNQLTPYLVVNVNYSGVSVPMEFVRDGQIVLNIAMQAVGNFDMTNEVISFNARFGGIPHQVNIPMGSVMAIYARENGAGTMFEPEPAYEENQATFDEERPKAFMQLVTESGNNDEDALDDPPPHTPQPPRGRPTLRVVK